MTYRYNLNNKLSQGDIFRGVRVITNVVGAENNGPKYDESNIIVISRNCEIDKPLEASNSVLVARVRKLSSQGKRFQGYIRDYEILNAFYIPSDDQFLEECWVDWRTLQPTNKDKLYRYRSQQDFYKCTLDDTMLKACLGHLYVFLSKEEENEQDVDVHTGTKGQQTDH